MAEVPFSPGKIDGPIRVTNAQGDFFIDLNMHGRVRARFEQENEDFRYGNYDFNYTVPRVTKYRVILEVEPTGSSDHQLTIYTDAKSPMVQATVRRP